MIKKPVVGMVVTLNDSGLDNIFGSKMGLSHMKTKELRITEIYSEIPLDDCRIWDIAVDDKDISQFMINTLDFDEVIL